MKKNSKSSRAILSLLMLTATALPLYSQEKSQYASGIPNPLEWNGYVRGSLFGGSEQYDFNTSFAELSLQSRLNRERSMLFIDLRIRQGFRFGQSYSEIQLKEAYAGYRGKRLDFFFGNQIVTWGRTDGFNPTNNINPSDYFLLTSDADDQIMPNFMMQLKYAVKTSIEISLIAIPVFKPSVYQYELFEMGTGVSFLAPVEPKTQVQNSSLAARIKFEYPWAGFSFSLFHGYDPFYGFNIDSIDLSQTVPDIAYQPDFYKKTVIGFDLELTAGTWIIRTEAAWNITQNYKGNMHIPNPNIYYVFGLEHHFSWITAIVQYIEKYTLDYHEPEQPVLEDPTDPAQLAAYAENSIRYESELFNQKAFNLQNKHNQLLFLSLNRYFAYEAIQTELTAYYNFSNREYLIRPSLTWKITGDLSATAGANYINGNEESIYSKAKPLLNGMFIQLKMHF